MIDVQVLCQHCGTTYSAPIDAQDKKSLCPLPNCSSKKTKCIKCDQFATYTQPDKDTGQIIDVCDNHFLFKYMG